MSAPHRARSGRVEARVLRVAHGTLAILPIDETPAAVLLAPLPDAERALAATYGERRARTFAAGRSALRRALEGMGGLGVDVAAPILRTPRGAPWVPGARASVAHKDEVAVALAAPGDGPTLGVDVEVVDADRRLEIETSILTDAELTALPDDPVARERETLLRFALKEALYKAIDPHVRRFVGFQEVEAWPQPDGTARVVLHLAEKGFRIDARHMAFGDVLVTTVTASR